MTNPIPEYIDKRKAEIAAMPRKELNGHAFLLEQEQVEYEKEIAKLKEERDKYKWEDEQFIWLQEQVKVCSEANQQLLGERNALLEGLKGKASELKQRIQSRQGPNYHDEDKKITILEERLGVYEDIIAKLEGYGPVVKTHKCDGCGQSYQEPTFNHCPACLNYVRPIELEGSKPHGTD